MGLSSIFGVPGFKLFGVGNSKAEADIADGELGGKLERKVPEFDVPVIELEAVAEEEDEDEEMEADEDEDEDEVKPDVENELEVDPDWTAKFGIGDIWLSPKFDYGSRTLPTSGDDKVYVN